MVHHNVILQFAAAQVESADCHHAWLAHVIASSDFRPLTGCDDWIRLIDTKSQAHSLREPWLSSNKKPLSKRFIHIRHHKTSVKSKKSKSHREVARWMCRLRLRWIGLPLLTAGWACCLFPQIKRPKELKADRNIQRCSTLYSYIAYERVV